MSLALLAGCADDPAPVDEVPDEPTDAAAPPAQTLMGTDTFGWEVSAGVPTTGVDTQVGSSNAMTIDVPAGATRLSVTATWSCATPQCDLHFYADMQDPPAFPPSPTMLMRDGAHAMGASPLTLTVEDPAPGEWWASVHSDLANAQVSGTFSFEVAFDEAAPGEAGASAST